MKLLLINYILWLSCSLLDEIANFVQKQSDDGFMKSLTMKHELPILIESFYRRIDATVASLQVCSILLTFWGAILACNCQISSLVNIQNWQVQNASARKKDTRDLHDRLRKLELDHCLLREMLSTSNYN